MIDRLAITLAAALALAGCKAENRPPPPNTAAAVSMDPARWAFQASPGMPAGPAAHAEGWAFDFPARDGPGSVPGAGVHYLVSGVRGFLAGTMTARFRIEADAGAAFRESDPCGAHNASARLYFQRRGDVGTVKYEDYRWWSNPAHVVLAAGGFELSAPIVASEWSQVLGKKGDGRAQAFAAAAADVQAVGITFGGCFFGHGAYLASGSARFVMTDFAVR
jgi:hypothetical protein